MADPMDLGALLGTPKKEAGGAPEDEVAMLTAAGFTDDQAAAIYEAIQSCMSKTESAEPMSGPYSTEEA